MPRSTTPPAWPARGRGLRHEWVVDRFGRLLLPAELDDHGTAGLSDDELAALGGDVDSTPVR